MNKKVKAKGAQPTALYPLGKQLLTPVALAEILAVCPGTIYSWISRGVDLPFIKIAGSVRFRRESVQNWLLDKEKARKRRNFE